MGLNLSLVKTGRRPVFLPLLLGHRALTGRRRRRRCRRCLVTL